VLTVHLLGHAHITQNGQPVPLSAKAVALIAYLAAEKLPQHRERLADLLWNTAEARTNLRVELARIRSAGLNIFPASRQLLYLESINTDIDQWETLQEHEMNQTELSAWLATLRGLPLCGLEDLGSTAFQVWVEQQRWMMCEKVESTLARVYAHYLRSGQEWATRLISSRAEAVGFTDPTELLTDAMIEEAVPLVRAQNTGARLSGFPSNGNGNGQGNTKGSGNGPLMPPSGRASRSGAGARPGQEASGIVGPIVGAAALQNGGLPGTELLSTELPGTELPGTELHFVRPQEERQLRELLSGSGSQIVLLHGPPGSGKTYLAERLARQATPGWEVLRLTASRSGRLLLAALAQALLKLADPDQVLVLRQVLLQPGAIEEDMVKVAVAVAQISQPLLLLLDEVQTAPPELTGLLELVCQMSSDHARLFVLLGRGAPDRQTVTRTLLRRLPTVQTLALTPITLASVQQVLAARYPGEPAPRLQPLASRLTQRSEGNPQRLLSLLNVLPEAASLGQIDLGEIDLGSAALPQAVRDLLRSEPEAWSEQMRAAMSRLSVINGAFDRLTAQAALNLDRENEVDTLLCSALERQILMEVDAGVALTLPDLRPVRLAPEADTQYLFRQEALRVTLAGQLPQLIRQDVRKRLVTALAAHEPGLASYYAERAGLQEQATQLWDQYQAGLPQGSPLLVSEMQGAVQPVVRASVPEPQRQSIAPQQSASQQGYTVTVDSNWLNVMSDGRYGHPQTLTLRMNWPTPLTGALRLIWRLDLFSGGEELRPSLSPFPLRLMPVQAAPALKTGPRGPAKVQKRAAFVYVPQRGKDYQEQHLEYRVQPGVEVGQWMEHVLSGPEWQGATGVDISVRALDVALSIGVLSNEGEHVEEVHLLKSFA
jgi:AAA ATPase domain